MNDDSKKKNENTSPDAPEEFDFGSLSFEESETNDSAQDEKEISVDDLLGELNELMEGAEDSTPPEKTPKEEPSFSLSFDEEEKKEAQRRPPLEEGEENEEEGNEDLESTVDTLVGQLSSFVEKPDKPFPLGEGLKKNVETDLSTSSQTEGAPPLFETKKENTELTTEESESQALPPEVEEKRKEEEEEEEEEDSSETAPQEEAGEALLPSKKEKISEKKLLFLALATLALAFLVFDPFRLFFPASPSIVLEMSPSKIQSLIQKQRAKEEQTQRAAEKNAQEKESIQDFLRKRKYWEAQTTEEGLTFTGKAVTVDATLREFSIGIRGEKPPKLTPEAIVAGKTLAPWIRRIDFRPHLAAPKNKDKQGFFRIQGTARAYLEDEIGSERSIVELSVVAKLDEQTSVFKGSWTAKDKLGDYSAQTENILRRDKNKKFSLYVSQPFVLLPIESNPVESNSTSKASKQEEETK